MNRKKRTIDEVLNDLRTLAGPLKVYSVNYDGRYEVRTANGIFVGDTARDIERILKKALKG